MKKKKDEKKWKFGSNFSKMKKKKKNTKMKKKKKEKDPEAVSLPAFPRLVVQVGLHAKVLSRCAEAVSFFETTSEANCPDKP